MKRVFHLCGLAIDLEITQKTAWFVLHRIIEILKDKTPKTLDDTKTVEIDEAFISGKEENKHMNKKTFFKKTEVLLMRISHTYLSRKIVIGIIERNGNVV